MKAKPREWMYILKETYKYFRGLKCPAVIIGSQAISLHLMVKGKMDYRRGLPSKDIDISTPQLEVEGEFNVSLLKGLVKHLQRSRIKIVGVETIDAMTRGLVAHIFTRLPSLKPFTVEIFSTVISLPPQPFILDASQIEVEEVIFKVLNPVDVVVTRLAAPTPIERLHVERLRRFIKAFNIQPREVAFRITTLNLTSQLRGNLKRMRKLNLKLWTNEKWVRFTGKMVKGSLPLNHHLK